MDGEGKITFDCFYIIRNKIGRLFLALFYNSNVEEKDPFLRLDFPV